MISKYQFMETNTQKRGQGLRDKIPDIKKTLDMVRFLSKRRKVWKNCCLGRTMPPPWSVGRSELFFCAGCSDSGRYNTTQTGTSEPISTSFELSDTLYARAAVTPEDTDEVYLWLGANVMLAYPTDEAEVMLDEKLRAAEASLANCDEDLEFLKEQITVRPFSYTPPLIIFLIVWKRNTNMFLFSGIQTLEVATARVYNWDVVQKRKDKAEGKGDDEGEAKEEPNG